MNKDLVLGIDPGTNVLGFALIDCSNSPINLVEMGVINMTRYKTQHEKLLEIFQSVAKLILKYRPAEMAIEAPFYGKNPQSMLKLGRAQGVAIAAALTREIKVVEYSPKKIKMAITGSGNASKEQVAGMLEHLVVGNVTHKYLDATDALATAVCHSFQNKRATQGKQYSNWNAFIKDNPDRVG